MKANLTLFYSTNVYLDLIVEEEIEILDAITTQYESQEDFRNSPQFRQQFDNFYIKTQNYRNKIMNSNDKKGHLYLTYLDQDNIFRKLRVLYKKDSDKKKPVRVVNAIKKSLKEKQDNQIIISLFREYNFILGTEYNEHHYKLQRILKDLSYSDEPSPSTIAKYNTLVKIVYDELIKGYNKTNDTITPSSYYHIRLIDEFLEIKKKLPTTTKTKNQVKIVKENVKKVESSSLKGSLLAPRNISWQSPPYYDISDEEFPDFAIPDEEEEKKWTKK